MANAISNRDDVIDSRDVTARIEELEEEKAAAEELASASDDRRAEIDEELTALRKLAQEGESATSEWADGAALIRDSYFEDHPRELADDIGAINSDATWPNNCIDWERAARELQQDYTSVDFDGVTYWVR